MNVWHTREAEPPGRRLLIVYCPEWNSTGYQICEWNGKRFHYDDQPNDMFDGCVEAWALFLEYQ